MTDKKKCPRFYVSALTVGEVFLSAGESHHARSVRRLGAGDAVKLFDGRGGFAEGEIVNITRRETRVRVGEVAAQLQPWPGVHLGFAVPKGKRLDWLLEKATELAAASLWPVVFERSVAAGGKADRWAGHCLSAAKQCGLNWLPVLHEPRSLPDFLAGAWDKAPRGAESRTIFLAGDLLDSAASLAEVFQAESLGNSDGHGFDEVVLLIGPEGGFTEGERQAIAAGGFQPVRLGTTTLRIETAAIALLAGIRAM